MEYDRGNSFCFDLIPIGSKSSAKPSPRSYFVQFERKWKSIFPSVCRTVWLRRNTKKNKIFFLVRRNTKKPSI